LSYKPQLIILDLGLPDQSGLEWLRRFREWSQVPVIVLTVSDQEESKVSLLEAGADDYVTKPFGFPEIMARIKVALRHNSNEEPNPLFTTGDWEVDLLNRIVKVKGEVVKLTATEYEFLRLLVKNAGRVVAQETLLREIWGKTALGQNHYLRIYIGTLRKKLEADSSSPKHLLTEPGVGYRLV
jgi:two-component system KDP operon response regulator KdpE